MTLAAKVMLYFAFHLIAFLPAAARWVILALRKDISAKDYFLCSEFAFWLISCLAVAFVETMVLSRLKPKKDTYLAVMLVSLILISFMFICYGIGINNERMQINSSSLSFGVWLIFILIGFAALVIGCVVVVLQSIIVYVRGNN
ncbi:MAG: hypothetical protein JXD22_02600 [Sedimentisphaerales bacterium]|nr:hypothetical protein [Sedimentisphaerales bacterium]